jgi:hypothetical protein
MLPAETLLKSLMPNYKFLAEHVSFYSRIDISSYLLSSRHRSHSGCTWLHSGPWSRVVPGLLWSLYPQGSGIHHQPRSSYFRPHPMRQCICTVLSVLDAVEGILLLVIEARYNPRREQVRETEKWTLGCSLSSCVPQPPSFPGGEDLYNILNVSNTSYISLTT